MPKYETAKIVKEFRTRKQLSQETLGKKVDYDQQSISLIEAGKHTPAKQALEKILETTDAPMSKFNTPVDYTDQRRATIERHIIECIEHGNFEIHHLINLYANCSKLICCAFCQDKKEKNSRNRCFSAINHSDIR